MTQSFITVGIIWERPSLGFKRLFEHLEHIFPVRFQWLGPLLKGCQCDVLITKSTNPEALLTHPEIKHALCFLTESANKPFKGFLASKFEEISELPLPIRGKTLYTGEVEYCTPLTVSAPWQTVAQVNGQTIWAISCEQHATIHQIAFNPPELQQGERLSQHLNGESFLRLLPLYVFLKQVTAKIQWQNPIVSACLLFDDPNLHWPSYGYLNYQTLIQLAQRHNFHASMAMVPFDCWWTHSKTKRLFLENTRHLSLLIHGNNHTPHEMAQFATKSDESAFVQQAFDRIKQFEIQNGIIIPRIFVPPFSTIAISLMTHLATTECLGVTANRWSLWKFNDIGQTTLSIGLQPADIMGGGLPVLNRFRYSYRITRNEIALAALLGQPIIPYGHHYDCKDDYAQLLEAVSWINELGHVTWEPLDKILMRNYQWRIEGARLYLRLFSKHIALNLPEGIQEVVVTNNGFSPEQSLAVVQTNSHPSTKAATKYRFEECIPVVPGQQTQIQVLSEISQQKNHSLSVSHPIHYFGRRIISEVRDRLLPILYQ